MTHKARKDYERMTPAELARTTEQYDKEFAGIPGNPLTLAQKALHRRAAKRGRTSVGKEPRRISIAVEPSLLRLTDAAAQSMGLTRGQFVAQILERELGAAANR